MNIWVVSRFWLLQIQQIRMFVHKILSRHMLSFILDEYLGMEWLDCIVSVCLTLPSHGQCPAWAQFQMYHFPLIWLDKLSNNPLWVNGPDTTQLITKETNGHLVVQGQTSHLYNAQLQMTWPCFRTLGAFHKLYKKAFLTTGTIMSAESSGWRGEAACSRAWPVWEHLSALGLT